MPAADFSASGSVNLRSLGATLTLPFIEWRKMRLSSDKAALQAQRAEIQFRDAVYRALADVDNAMRQRLEAQRQIGNQRQASGDEPTSRGVGATSPSVLVPVAL
ncbi:TolC family protein [Serratia ureilytica]